MEESDTAKLVREREESLTNQGYEIENIYSTLIKSKKNYDVAEEEKDRYMMKACAIWLRQELKLKFLP